MFVNRRLPVGPNMDKTNHSSTSDGRTRYVGNEEVPVTNTTFAVGKPNVLRVDGQDYSILGAGVVDRRPYVVLLPASESLARIILRAIANSHGTFSIDAIRREFRKEADATRSDL
jgi:hypothetical protein